MGELQALRVQLPALRAKYLPCNKIYELKTTISRIRHENNIMQGRVIKHFMLVVYDDFAHDIGWFLSSERYNHVCCFPSYQIPIEDELSDDPDSA